jgi:hypothetical protein
MRFGLTTLLFVLFLLATAEAQTPNENSASNATNGPNQPATPPPANAEQTDPATTSNQPPLPPIELKRRKNTPESPQPKIEDEWRTCPGGNGKPCAVLGGRLYFSDSLALSQHNKSWADAAKSPGMLLTLGLLTASTIADIETTHACIRAGTCKEGNPLLGQSRAQAYSVAMSVNAFAYWAAAEQKRHGRGVVPFFILWGDTAMHSLLAAHNSALAAK